MTQADATQAQKPVATRPTGFAFAAGIAVAAIVDLLTWNDLEPRYGPLLMVAAVTSLAIHDARTSLVHRPTVRIATLLVFVAVAIEAARVGEWSWLIGSLAAAAIVYGVFLLLWLLPFDTIGGGDLRLGALIGAGLGPLGASTTLQGIIYAFIAAALIGLPIGLFAKHKATPFGPGLAIGAIAAILLHV